MKSFCRVAATSRQANSMICSVVMRCCLSITSSVGIGVLKEPLANYYNGTDATKPLDNVDLLNDLQTTTLTTAELTSINRGASTTSTLTSAMISPNSVPTCAFTTTVQQGEKPQPIGRVRDDRLKNCIQSSRRQMAVNFSRLARRIAAGVWGHTAQKIQRGPARKRPARWRRLL